VQSKPDGTQEALEIEKQTPTAAKFQLVDVKKHALFT
jgi:hypothetical protein